MVRPPPFHHPTVASVRHWIAHLWKHLLTHIVLSPREAATEVLQIRSKERGILLSDRAEQTGYHVEEENIRVTDVSSLGRRIVAGREDGLSLPPSSIHGLRSEQNLKRLLHQLDVGCHWGFVCIPFLHPSRKRGLEKRSRCVVICKQAVRQHNHIKVLEIP